MKRGLIFSGLLLTGAVLGAVVYATSRPEPSEEQHRLDWLAAELELNASQRSRVTELHQRYCPQICELNEACERGESLARSECRETTQRLIRAVSGELSPLQRMRYHELVAPCLVPPTNAAHQ